MATAPPTIHELMDDPVFREYMKRRPPTTVQLGRDARPHPALTTGHPYGIWLHMDDGRWKTGTFATYEDAWTVFRRAFKTSTVRDVSLFSRRVFFGPPGEWRKFKRRRKDGGFDIVERWVRTFAYHTPGLEWCGRCRRPSSFRMLFPDHHALRRQPCLTVDEPLRCWYCGIRHVAMPAPEHMEIIE